MTGWMVIYKIGEVFDIMYRIGYRFNGKGDGCFVVEISIMI